MSDNRGSGSGGHGGLTARDREVLDALPTSGWWRPMDVGGTDGSHHSQTLAKLVRRGLVARKRHWLGFTGGHWRYQRVCQETDTPLSPKSEAPPPLNARLRGKG